MPGCVESTWSTYGFPATPLTVAITGFDPIGVFAGTSALICDALTKLNAAEAPPIVTETPPRAAGNAAPSCGFQDCGKAGPRLAPTMVTHAPGAAPGV